MVRFGTVWYGENGHLLVSCLSLLNNAGSGGTLYPASLLPTFIVLIVTIVIAVRLAGGTLSGLRKALACSPATLQVPAEG